MVKTLLRWIDNLSILFSYNITNSRKTFYELEQMNFRESAQYIDQHGGSAMLLEKKNVFWKHGITSILPKGMLLEFGVFKGGSINYFSSVLSQQKDARRIYGFDSFEGLSEDWAGTHMSASTFDQGGNMPKVNPNVTLIKGWVDETVPPFIKEHLSSGEKIAFLHMDMDTYTPTKVVFELVVDLIQEGTVIVFDELLGYSGWKEGEYKALMEVIAPKWEFEYLAFCEPRERNRHKSKYIRASLRITKRKAG